MSPDAELPPQVEDPVSIGANESLVAPADQENNSKRLLEPQFLHPTSVLFEIASRVRQLVVPVVIGLYSASQGGRWGAGIAILVFAGALIGTFFRYFTLRYRIQDSDLVISEGLLFRRVRAVPVRRIQNVDLVQNILHRIFGVAEVKIETASGTEAEATLRVLTKRQIQELREAIFAGASDSQSADALPQPEDNHQAAEFDSVVGTETRGGAFEVGASRVGTSEVVVNKISMSELLLAGLASNRGIVFFGIAMGVVSQTGLFGDTFETVSKSTIEQLRAVNQQENPWFLGLAFVVFSLCLFGLLKLAGMAWYVQRFYGHQLVRVGNDLRIACGLFTRVSATVPVRRVQFISVHRSFVMRLFGLAAIRIETAGGGGSEKENASATVSRRWFLPVVRYNKVQAILEQLRPGLKWEEDSIKWHSVSQRTFRRLLRLVVVISLLVGLIGFAISQPWGSLAGLVVFPGLLWLALKKSRAMRYAHESWGVAYRSGILTKKLSFSFFDRMQTLSVKQSPFDRRWKMARLQVDTAAAGPAEHQIDVAYLDEDFAFKEFRSIQSATARHRPTWA